MLRVCALLLSHLLQLLAALQVALVLLRDTRRLFLLLIVPLDLRLHLPLQLLHAGARVVTVGRPRLAGQAFHQLLVLLLRELTLGLRLLRREGAALATRRCGGRPWRRLQLPRNLLLNHLLHRLDVALEHVTLSLDLLIRHADLGELVLHVGVVRKAVARGAQARRLRARTPAVALARPRRHPLVTLWRRRLRRVVLVLWRRRLLAWRRARGHRAVLRRDRVGARLGVRRRLVDEWRRTLLRHRWPCLWQRRLRRCRHDGTSDGGGRDGRAGGGHAHRARGGVGGHSVCFVVERDGDGFILATGSPVGFRANGVITGAAPTCSAT